MTKIKDNELVQLMCTRIMAHACVWVPVTEGSYFSPGRRSCSPQGPQASA
jgi:hypothetical protein